MILSIDPGTTESAYVLYDEKTCRVDNHWKLENSGMRQLLREDKKWPEDMQIVIEMVACYGQPVGKEVFETCLWIGRYLETIEERWKFKRTGRPTLIYRADVKKHLCHKVIGINDSVIRQALIDRFGPTKEVAIGKKKSPGPLYGISGDEWAALALAVTFADQKAASAAHV